MSETITEIKKSTFLPNMVQGSEDWHKWRDKKRSASLAGVIMGCAPSWSPVKTWEDLRMEQAGLAARRSDFLERAAKRGLESEREALQRFKQERPHHLDYEPVCVEYGEFAASLDGYAKPFWVEIKTPARGKQSKLWELMEGNGVQVASDLPAHYFWQLVHQAWSLQGHKVEGVFFIVFADGDILFRLFHFDDLMENAITLVAEWNRFADGEEQGRGDAEWRVAAEHYRTVKGVLDRYKKALGDARAKLVSLAGDSDTCGRGVSVRHVKTKGTIDYKEFAKALYVGEGFADEAEEYRGEETMKTRVTITEGA